MKTILLFFYLVIAVIKINAQDFQRLDPIQTDRPDQTESPFLTPVNYFQMETGIWSEKISPSNIFSTTVPTILTKYGVNNNFELRLITEYNFIHGQYKKYFNGIPPITIGFKSKLLEENKWIPQTSIICHLGIKHLSTEDFMPDAHTPSYRFLCSHTLTKKLNLSYNLGHEWNGFDAEATFIYTLSTAYSFNRKLGGFIELYGFIPNKMNADNRFDAGLTYQITPDQQFDISSGFGFNTLSPAYFISAGYSFRFKK